MSSKTQNIISNIFGIILWATAVYLLLTSGDSYQIVVSLSVGALLFLYKVNESKLVLKRLIDGYLGKEKSTPKNTYAIGEDQPLPDEEINP